MVKPINYYSLKWQWKERSDWSVIEQAAAVLSDESNLSRTIDLESTRQMICLDNLPPHEVASSMAAHEGRENDTQVPSLSASGDAALPPGSDRVMVAAS